VASDGPDERDELGQHGQVEAATRALRSLDYQYGGGFCRDAVVAQLSWASRSSWPRSPRRSPVPSSPSQSSAPAKRGPTRWPAHTHQFRKLIGRAREEFTLAGGHEAKDWFWLFTKDDPVYAMLAQRVDLSHETFANPALHRVISSSTTT
jgi:hypothetical protein